MTYYFSVIYPPKRFGGPQLTLHVKDHVTVTAFLKNLDVDQKDLDTIKSVLSKSLPDHTIRLDAMLEAVIGPIETYVSRIDWDEKGTILRSDTETIATEKLYEFATILKDAESTFKDCVASGSDWNGIPTKLTPEEGEKPHWETGRYWVPETGERGNLQELSDAQEWIERAKKTRNG